VLAPERLSHLDVRRWCLRCSGKSPTLIERSIPSKATERAHAAATRAKRTAARQERRAAKTSENHARTAQLLSANDRARVDAADWLRGRISSVLRLDVWRTERLPSRPWPPQITIRQGGPGRIGASGHAWWNANRLVVTTGLDAADDLATLVHEVAHIVINGRGESHGPRFRALEAAAISELVDSQQPVPLSSYAGRPLVAAVRAWLGPEDPALHVGDQEAAAAARDAATSGRLREHSAKAWPRVVYAPEGRIFNATDSHNFTAWDEGSLKNDIAEGTRTCDLGDECDDDDCRRARGGS
jgi:hypothetical protein